MKVRSHLQIYVLPVVLTLPALLFSSWLRQPGTAPLLLFVFVAVLLSTYWGNWISAVIATSIATIGMTLLMAEPIGSLRVASTDSAVRIVAFFGTSLIGTLLILRLQKALHRERVLRELIESSPTLTVVTDESGRILSFNRECERITGYQRDEVVGKTVGEMFLLPEWQPIVAKRFQDIDSPEVREPHDNPWRTKKGDLRLIQWRCRAVRRRFEPTVIIAIGVDITEARKSEAMRIEVERLAEHERLVADLAHELNNPLQVLTNVFGLLAAKLDGDGTAEFKNIIEKELPRVAAISKRLLRATNSPKASANRN